MGEGAEALGVPPGVPPAPGVSATDGEGGWADPLG
eukprot:CAMPEP_0114145392 /NCGR_PEP_ID=MMETSP0043_2-20121206/20025_1 /TAXON_ID=464988 /ORGANISM="Hemiselmis andersenii, Strain CCMP644" /LENGTH=34 /DNA_ID= /DNA_START= /DNA_END= /DNA_ORIENTATION=